MSAVGAECPYGPSKGGAVVSLVPDAGAREPDSAPLAMRHLKHGGLKAFEALPRGMPATHPDIVRAEPLASIHV